MKGYAWAAIGLGFLAGVVIAINYWVGLLDAALRA